MGSRGSGSRDVLRHHGIPTPAAERGLVLIEQKMGKDLLHFACRHHILELVVHAGVSSVFLGVPHRPSICSSNASKPHGRASTREDFGTGIMVEEVATVLEDVKRVRLFDGLFKSFKSVRTFAMGYRELVKLVIIFLGGALPVEFDSLLLEQCTRPDGCQSPLLLQIWMFRASSA
ncbi:hypothetical protein GWK47_029381 [Chionoecetes opilio]|uniref:Uncharacterized protein n=1 Tax=Chionoecetes opilio TaxID=41210 RepID=A0A8J4YLI2_CHIOP|nr:hypothetical protein GWK47_029381 [Chionoecetes opilio]